ncbi:hypothetical protein BC829DRAFT_450569 [Chytridium lagenaria]|nr:hypothetical protein BC829DRAFT_450569 [Chytridium lagenaria]
MRKEKELLLRLVRLRIEKQEELTQGKREEGRNFALLRNRFATFDLDILQTSF